MTRLDIPTGIPFDPFVAAFDREAPALNTGPFQEILATGGDWDDVRAAMAQQATHGLVVYAKLDASPLFALAGHRVHAVEYLLGNQVIAETMFRHDPHAMLYAPLRVLLFSDEDGAAVVAIDQPSTVFGGLGHDAVAEVGAQLDGRVAELLRALGVDVTDALEDR